MEKQAINLAKWRLKLTTNQGKTTWHENLYLLVISSLPTCVPSWKEMHRSQHVQLFTCGKCISMYHLFANISVCFKCFSPFFFPQGFHIQANQDNTSTAKLINLTQGCTKEIVIEFRLTQTLASTYFSPACRIVRWKIDGTKPRVKHGILAAINARPASSQEKQNKNKNTKSGNCVCLVVLIIWRR